MSAGQLSSSAPLSLPFSINSTGLAQGARQRETDAHGRAQSRHTAQHRDISARRQTVRIPSLTPLVRNQILSVILLMHAIAMQAGRKGASDPPPPYSNVFALLLNVFAIKRQMLENSGC